MDITLAIVIPFYKNDFFLETLKSLKRQTDKRFRVYIGDDASPNDISKNIEDYNTDLDITYHRFSENLGGYSLTKHWDRCIDLIKNESWVCILGDDDCISDNFVECFYAQLPKLNQNKSNILRFASLKIDQYGKHISNIQKNNELELASESFIQKFYGAKHSSLSEHVFSVKAYKKYGFRDYPLAWCSDDMAWLEFSEGKNIISDNRAHLQFRLSPKSISGTLDNKKYEAKKMFFRDLVALNYRLFPSEVAVKNLKKYEVFLVLTNSLELKHFIFFIKHFFRLNNYIECVKFPIRYTINMFKK